MLTSVAIQGYRSLRELVLPLYRLTVVTGANGTGKSSLYRALQLLSDCGRGEIIGSLARQGGLPSAMWAGPGQVKGARRSGVAQPIVRTGSRYSVQLGYASDDFGYVVDLGLPAKAESAFSLDPEIKREYVFSGPVLRPSSTLMQRTRSVVEARAESGRGFEGISRSLPTYRSVLAEFPGRLPELGAVRDILRDWRFYDGFRVDADAPARGLHIGTRTPVLANDGSDLAAAVQTIAETGDDTFHRCVFDAFDGAHVSAELYDDGRFGVQLQQAGMLRPLRAAELSDGTLRFILWAAALSSPRPPTFMVVNEPETSLHPDLIAPLASLIRAAALTTQLMVVTHSKALLHYLGAQSLRDLQTEDDDEIDDRGQAIQLELVKDFGETQVTGLRMLTIPPWQWGAR